MTFSPVGSFTFSSMVRSEIVDLKGNLTIDEVTSGDQKIITASFEIPAHKFDNGDWGWSLNIGYIDKYTGTALMSGGSGDEIATTITIDNVAYDIIFKEEYIEGNDVEPTYFNLKVTCPTDYDGTAFFICGTDDSLDADIVYDVYIPASKIAYGNYDILYFCNQ